MPLDEPGAGREVEETPTEVAYRELAHEHAVRLYHFVLLMVERPAVAQDVAARAWRQTWEALRRGQLYMDPDEMLYRYAAREAVRRLAGSRDLRGYQPPTTGDGRHITAVGVVDAFTPEQRAGIFLAAWAGMGYSFAGAASGLGEGRSRDVCFAARQEYREARQPGGEGASAAICSQITPRLSEDADGQLREQDRPEVEAHLAICPACAATLVLYEDFAAALRELRLPAAEPDPLEVALEAPRARPYRRPGGIRQALQVATGSAALLVLFVFGFFVFRWCEPPPVSTGVGRTPDVVYARASEGEGILVLDSGSGRELGRLPAGILSRNGWRVYSSSSLCGQEACTTSLVATDTATGEAAPAGHLEGRLRVVAVDDAEQMAYLADEDASGDRLVAFDLKDARATGVVTGPAEVAEAFNPSPYAVAPSSPTLFTLGRSRAGGGPAVVSTDLSSMKVTGWLSLEGVAELGIGLVAGPDGKSLFVYLPSGPVLQEVDPAAGRVLRTLSLGGPGETPEGAYIPQQSALIAADSQGEFLYLALPQGGVAVVSQEPLEVVREVAVDRRYRALAASTDGRLLYVLGFDESYRVLDSTTGEQIRSRSGVRAADFLQVNAGE